MKITDINTPNAINFSRHSNPRFAETVSEVSAGTDNPVPADIKLGKKTYGNEENGSTSEKLDNRQIDDMLSKAISKANEKLEPMSVEFQFSVHEKTGRVNLKIVNSGTKDVVREIPSVEALDALAKILELAGIIVDEKK